MTFWCWHCLMLSPLSSLFPRYIYTWYDCIYRNKPNYNTNEFHYIRCCRLYVDQSTQSQTCHIKLRINVKTVYFHCSTIYGWTSKNKCGSRLTILHLELAFSALLTLMFHRILNDKVSVIVNTREQNTKMMLEKLR